MNADVGDDASRALVRPFPRHVVPASARGDVGERDLMAAVAAPRQLLAERQHRRVHAQLEHRADALTGLVLELLQRVEVPGIDDERLLADRVRPDSQRKADVRVVKIVRRADAHVVDALFVGGTAKLLQVTIEAFDLGEEPDVEADSDRARRPRRADRRPRPAGCPCRVIAFRCRGATNPPTPVIAKFFIAPAPVTPAPSAWRRRPRSSDEAPRLSAARSLESSIAPRSSAGPRADPAPEAGIGD